jgi:hypothetical protein
MTAVAFLSKPKRLLLLFVQFTVCSLNLKAVLRIGSGCKSASDFDADPARDPGFYLTRFRIRIFNADPDPALVVI